MYLKTRVLRQKATGKSRVEVRGRIQDTVMFKIPVEYLPIAGVTLNRKPLLFSLTKKAPWI